jgi:hypothetical protein
LEAVGVMVQILRTLFIHKKSKEMNISIFVDSKAGFWSSRAPGCLLLGAPWSSIRVTKEPRNDATGEIFGKWKLIKYSENGAAGEIFNISKKKIKKSSSNPDLVDTIGYISNFS